MAVRIYHNPNCSKSRATLELLRDRGVEPEIIEYLKTPPSEAELEAILTDLGFTPRELMRRNEPEYRDHALDSDSLTREQLIRAMVQHPRLIERPIVVNRGKVAIGRPPEAVLKIL
ncbi:arsenate reductase (glutaredoxin) [Nitrococcus mobilis]|uniref:Arsenate reductase n=1 Tax=Nitrococcus mobilis Nb-231 TaxID=314278 RepID=A4BSN4_9GAMM|nr:arsenate reductase (glutaredoxin) [Nitrococcus mobilis]EAR21304.1 Arsenate reductase [Nitrococcus mobilis Nb-231]